MHFWVENLGRHQHGQTKNIVEGSLEVKLPTICRGGKSRGGKSQRGEEKKREDQRGERLRRKKMQVGEKAGKSAIHCVFPMTSGSAAMKN